MFKVSNCERGDQCLFKHEGSNDEILSADVNQAHREDLHTGIQ